MINFLKAIKAFLIRDATSAVSYRLQFALSLLSIFFVVASLYFISKLVGTNPAFGNYGGYLPYAAIGMALMSYFQTGFNGFSSAIRSEQVMGTLESLLMTPAKISVIVISSSAWKFFWSTLTAAVYIFSANLFFGIELQGNYLVAALVLFLTILVFSCLGVISASIIMVFKQGNPFNVLMGAMSMFLGTVFFPVEELPEWLQGLSKILPITHGLKGLRMILLEGKSFNDVLPQIGILLIFTALGVPLSLYCFKKAVM